VDCLLPMSLASRSSRSASRGAFWPQSGLGPLILGRLTRRSPLRIVSSVRLMRLTIMVAEAGEVLPIAFNGCEAPLHLQTPQLSDALGLNKNV
jgi:hypothetical protein